MIFVKRGELGENGLIDTFETVGRFGSIREIKDHAWAYCHENGKRCMYLCYTFGYLDNALQRILVLNKENGCIRLREEIIEDSNIHHSLEAIVERFLNIGAVSQSSALG